MVPTKVVRSTMPALVLGMAALGTFGCAAEHADHEEALAHPTGTLLQKWTIEGAADPRKCDANGAARMRVVLIDSAGNVDATELAPCSSFQLGHTLDVGDYTGSATFLAANGFPVSQTLSIPTFSIRRDQTTTQTIDFPRAAVTPPAERPQLR